MAPQPPPQAPVYSFSQQLPPLTTYSTPTPKTPSPTTSAPGTPVWRTSPPPSQPSPRRATAAEIVAAPTPAPAGPAPLVPGVTATRSDIALYSRLVPTTTAVPRTPYQTLIGGRASTSASFPKSASRTLTPLTSSRTSLVPSSRQRRTATSPSPSLSTSPSSVTPLEPATLPAPASGAVSVSLPTSSPSSSQPPPSQPPPSQPPSPPSQSLPSQSLSVPDPAPSSPSQPQAHSKSHSPSPAASQSPFSQSAYPSRDGLAASLAPSPAPVPTSVTTSAAHSSTPTATPPPVTTPPPRHRRPPEPVALRRGQIDTLRATPPTKTPPPRPTNARADALRSAILDGGGSRGAGGSAERRANGGGGGVANGGSGNNTPIGGSGGGGSSVITSFVSSSSGGGSAAAGSVVSGAALSNGYVHPSHRILQQSQLQSPEKVSLSASPTAVASSSKTGMSFTAGPKNVPGTSSRFHSPPAPVQQQPVTGRGRTTDAVSVDDCPDPVASGKGRCSAHAPWRTRDNWRARVAPTPGAAAPTQSAPLPAQQRALKGRDCPNSSPADSVSSLPVKSPVMKSGHPAVPNPHALSVQEQQPFANPLQMPAVGSSSDASGNSGVVVDVNNSALGDGDGSSAAVLPPSIGTPQPVGTDYLVVGLGTSIPNISGSASRAESTASGGSFGGGVSSATNSQDAVALGDAVRTVASPDAQISSAAPAVAYGFGLGNGMSATSGDGPGGAGEQLEDGVLPPLPDPTDSDGFESVLRSMGWQSLDEEESSNAVRNSAVRSIY